MSRFQDVVGLSGVSQRHVVNDEGVFAFEEMARRRIKLEDKLNPRPQCLEDIEQLVSLRMQEQVSSPIRGSAKKQSAKKTNCHKTYLLYH